MRFIGKSMDSTVKDMVTLLEWSWSPFWNGPAKNSMWCQTFPLLLTQMGMARSAAYECGEEE